MADNRTERFYSMSPDTKENGDLCATFLGKRNNPKMALIMPDLKN